MKLDVRTKVLLVCFANLTFLFRVTGWLEMVTVVVLTVLLFLSGRRRMALYQFGFFLICLLIEFAFLEALLQLSIQLPATFLRASRLMMPSILAGSLLLSTSTAYELVHGLRKWYFPETMLLTFAVMLRFLPAIRKDARVLQQSLRLRGLFLTPSDLIFHPFSYFEFVMIPLMMSLLRRIQDLTMALLTKGVVVEKRATETFRSRFRLADWSVCVWILVMIVWMLL